jgi:hypothetical protein
MSEGVTLRVSPKTHERKHSEQERACGGEVQGRLGAKAAGKLKRKRSKMEEAAEDEETPVGEKRQKSENTENTETTEISWGWGSLG